MMTEVERELKGHILPFWMETADREHGGFYGEVDFDLVVHKDADKGGIAAARHLWTWSAAARRFMNPVYRDMADHAYAFLVRLIDPEYGGIYWTAHRDGTPSDTRKHVYAQAFAVYAFSEYALLTGSDDALRQARDIFLLIERVGYSAEDDRYLEEFDRTWSPLSNELIGEELQAETTTNTHLHLLEAYTSLYAACGDVAVGDRLAHLAELFHKKIYNPDRGCFDVFFDAHWKPCSSLKSFGHDIEATWLIWDALKALGCADVRYYRDMVLGVARSVLNTAVLPDGSLANEEEGGVFDETKVWWIQAEAVIGFVNAYSLTFDGRYMAAAKAVYAGIQNHVIDPRPNGEWFWSLDANWVPIRRSVGGPWKTPYHNARMCMEILDRLGGAHPVYFEALREQETLLSRPNAVNPHFYNGVYDRYQHPVCTRAHMPLHWRFDLSAESNPFFMERLGVNATLNAGAIYWNGKYYLSVRVEGADRKSFFALAESEHPTHGFRFLLDPVTWDGAPCPGEVNVYDLRLTAHEDGYIYGVFCSEHHDNSAPKGDTSSALAYAGIIRTRDLVRWERLENLRSKSSQQRNVVLHPEFIDGRYAFYTRPQDGFIDTGSGGGISFGTCEDITHAVVSDERLMDEKRYHTVYEVKNGLGPPPIRTARGFLHLAHGVRNTAAGLRYVLYCFAADLEKPWVVTHKPSGAFLTPLAGERVGDVSNVVFSNGWVRTDNDEIYIYYAASDTRMHVARTTLARLEDYIFNTPEDPFDTVNCVRQRIGLIAQNAELLQKPPAGKWINHG